MGFLKSLTKIIAAPIRIPVKAITGKDPFTDFVGTVKAVPQGLVNIAAFPVKVAGTVAQAALAGAVPQGGGLTVIGLPGSAPISGPSQSIVPQTFGPAAGISGGPAAFSSFSPFATSGGNPAWDFFQGSQARFPQSGISQAPSGGRWEVSGTSVRFLG